MTKKGLNILLIGATGSVGQHVITVAREAKHHIRALSRNPSELRDMPSDVEVVKGDLTRPETLTECVDKIDAIIFTHGSNGDKAANEAVDYGGVRNILSVFGSRLVQVALMTSIGVTERNGSYNRRTQAHDWKRRSERLLRASGHPYTIVRPGWFDYNKPGEHRLVLLQGDRRHSGTPQDGVISRRQIAEVLVHALTTATATRKTFELVAEHGEWQGNWEALFSQLAIDPPLALDGVSDLNNMPLADEPRNVKDDLWSVEKQRKEHC